MKTPRNWNNEKKINDILENAELDDYQRKLIAEKWISSLNYMNKQAIKNCWVYHITQITILLSGLLIPIIANIEDNRITIWITTSLGLATSIAAGINQLFKFERKWIHYRIIAENLRIEGFSFLGLSSCYSNF